MSLVELAVGTKPKVAKRIITKIVKNDLQVSKWMGRIK